MYCKAVQMHEVGKRKLSPGRDHQREDRSGDTDRIEEIVENFGGLYRMDGDDEYVDGTELKRQVLRRECIQYKETYYLEYLICNNKHRNCTPRIFSAACVEMLVQQTNSDTYDHRDNKPHGVSVSEALKAHALYFVSL